MDLIIKNIYIFLNFTSVKWYVTYDPHTACEFLLVMLRSLSQRGLETKQWASASLLSTRNSSIRPLTLDIAAGGKCHHLSDTRRRSTQQHCHTNQIRHRQVVTFLSHIQLYLHPHSPATSTSQLLLLIRPFSRCIWLVSRSPSGPSPPPVLTWMSFST